MTVNGNRGLKVTAVIEGSGRPLVIRRNVADKRKPRKRRGFREADRLSLGF